MTLIVPRLGSLQLFDFEQNSIYQMHKGNIIMKKEWYAKTFIVASILTSSLLVVQGCKKSDDKAIKIIELSRQIAPLQIRRSGENIEIVTLIQAMAWHESHEQEHGGNATGAAATSAQEEMQDSPGHLCLGVSTGYQAIRYAVDELFPEGVVPEASDFDIKVSGPMDGVWDVMSLYTGKELKFDGEPQEMGLESFTFTARRISQDKSLLFCLRLGLIPEEFFALKNQGATCASPALGKVKQQALLNVLSAEPKDCFQVIGAN